MQFRQTQIEIVDIPDMADIVLQLIRSHGAAVSIVAAAVAADRAQILRRNTAVQLQFFAMANRQRFYRLDAQPYEFYNQELNQPARKEWYLPANETREGRYANSPRADNASEWVRMQPLRAQLAIPPGTNVFLLGECPPVPLKHYHVLDGSENRNNFGFIDYGKTYEARCVVLRSSVDAPSNAGYQDRPWSVIAAPPGDVKANMRTASSSESFAMENLEIRVHIDCFGSSPNLYPTMGAVNAANVRRMYAVNCFFGLDNEVGSNYFTEDIT